LRDASDSLITLILPAYNEAESIGRTIREAREYFARRGYAHEIVVAADGDDGTREIAAGLGARVVGEPARRGKGRGVREAAAIARGRYVGYADADNKVPIDEFDKIYELLDQGFDVAIGTRASSQSRIERRQPWFRRAGSAAFNLLVGSLMGLGEIRDTQCGFKFFTAAAARELFRRQTIDGYMFDVEILALARKLGYRIGQAPIRWRDDGDTRLNLVRGNLRNVADILRIRFGQ
jgi:glycosyltransferase involved in cell wall biosynthesis